MPLPGSSLSLIIVIWLATLIAHAADTPPFDEPFDSLRSDHWVWAGCCVEDGVLSLVPTPSEGAARATTLDHYRQSTLEARVRLKGIGDKHYFYLGFFDRAKWGHSSCWLLCDGGGSFRLQTRRTGGPLDEHIATPRLEDNRWYVLRIVWEADTIEVFLDGQSCGKITDPQFIADTFLPVVADALAQDEKPAAMEIDYLRVTGSQRRFGFRPREGPVPLPPPCTERRLKRSPVQTRAAAASATIENGYYSVRLAFDPGLVIDQFSHRPLGCELLAAGKQSRLFVIALGDKTYGSDQFCVVRSSRHKQGLRLQLQCADAKLDGELELRGDDGEQLRAWLTLTNVGSETVKVGLCLPFLENLTIGNDLSACYVFFPFLAGWCGNLPVDLRADYGGMAWMQWMGVFNPSAGGGVYAYPEDASGALKTLMLRKQDRDDQIPATLSQSLAAFNDPGELFAFGTGAGMAVRHLERVLQPGESWTAPVAVIGVHLGDWHTGLNAYRRWARSWYRHVPQPGWFDYSFHTVSVHDFQGNYNGKGGFWSNEHGRYTCAENLTGVEDTVEWAFWWDYPKENEPLPWRVGLRKFALGDYAYPAQRGGLEAMREEIQRVQAKGTAVRLYMEYTQCWKDTQVGRAHGKDWARMDSPGVYCREYCVEPDDGWIVCGREQGWPDHVAERFTRIVRDTGAKSVRLDRGGICYPCFNPAHKHFDGSVRSACDQEAYARGLKTIRAALTNANPDAVLYLEHAGSDWMSQFADGATAQQFHFPADLQMFAPMNAYEVVFFRFLFPEFKLYNWGDDRPRVHDLTCLFNGIGQERYGGDLVRPITTTQHETGDALASLDCEPLVPTRPEGLSANRFACAAKTVYALYNRTDAPITGALLDVGARSGWHAVELFHDEPMSLARAAGGTVLTGSVNGGDVAVVALMPNALRIWKSSGKLQINVPRFVRATELQMFAGHDNGPPIQSATMPRQGGRVGWLWPSAGKCIVKWLDGKRLLDEQVFPAP